MDQQPKLDAQLTIRLPAELKADLRSQARLRQRSLNWLIVHVLGTWSRKAGRQRRP